MTIHLLTPPKQHSEVYKKAKTLKEKADNDKLINAECFQNAYKKFKKNSGDTFLP